MPPNVSQDNLNGIDAGEVSIHLGGSGIRNEMLRRLQENNLLQLDCPRPCPNDPECAYLKKRTGHRLICNAYSESRAKRISNNRERVLTADSENRVASGPPGQRNTSIKPAGPTIKFAQNSIGKVRVEIDEQKVLQDIRWDGLKGYLTNTNLSSDEVIGHYGQLWHIERAFRISKSDLRVRPIFHRLRRRIEAHILISFVAYAICKELERRLNLAGIPFSPKRAAELTQTMYEISFALPNDPQQHRVLLQMDDEQRQLYELLN